MGATEDLALRLQAEIDEQKAFQDSLIDGARRENRDLTEAEMDLFQRASAQMTQRDTQLVPIRESLRIAEQSRVRVAELAKFNGSGPAVEYRSFGAYAYDIWQSHQRGGDDAAHRVQMYHRAAAHQLTSDNPGLLPETIVGPLVNFVDARRPICTAVGVGNLPSGNFSFPKVTQHTLVAKQAAQKTELASQKLTITKTAVAIDTFGGYVNVAIQNRDWSTPQIIDIVTQDLADQYAKVTEAEAGGDLVAGATAGTGTGLPASPVAADVSRTLWESVTQISTGVPGAMGFRTFVSADVAAKIGPLFPSVNPTNAISPGFEAGGLSSGLIGYVSGIPIYMSTGLAAKSFVTTADGAFRVWEDRMGALSVTEPSVWGIQIGYAGYFADIVAEALGVVKATVA